MKMTTERKEVFLEHLAKHGLIGHAAWAASPHSKDGAKSSFLEERKKDPEFAAAWDEALVMAEEAILKEMHRRGVEGMVEDVYGSLGKDAGSGVVGQKRVYSDRLLELYSRVQNSKVARALSQAKKVEVSGKVVTTDLGLDKLNTKQQDLLQQLLEAGDEPDSTE